jgi:hypothetical protein
LIDILNKYRSKRWFKSDQSPWTKINHLGENYTEGKIKWDNNSKFYWYQPEFDKSKDD